MALCPFAVHKLIPPGSSDPRITPRVAILHVDAGNAFSLYEYFRDRSGGIESHFHVRSDGVIEQYRDTEFQADANNLANDFAVSIETQGFGNGEWNERQLASIKKLLTWVHEVHDIPLRKVQRWNGSGVGYHTLFGAPSQWTPVAKSCPGAERIKQFNDILVPWMADMTNGVTHRVVTYNVEHKRKPREVLHEVKRLAADHDVLLLQEAQEYRKILKTIPGFRVKGKGENYILVRNGLKVSDTRVAQVTARGWFTARGKRTKPEYVTYVTVDGIQYSSWHWPPSIQGKHQRLATPRRWGAAREMGANFILGDHAVGGGDFNVHARTDRGHVKGHPLDVFKRAGAERRHSGVGTHKSRDIDYFAVKGVGMTNIRVIHGFGSDHRPVSAVVTKRG